MLDLQNIFLSIFPVQLVAFDSFGLMEIFLSKGRYGSRQVAICNSTFLTFLIFFNFIVRLPSDLSPFSLLVILIMFDSFSSFLCSFLGYNIDVFLIC